MGKKQTTMECLFVVALSLSACSSPPPRSSGREFAEAAIRLGDSTYANVERLVVPHSPGSIPNTCAFSSAITRMRFAPEGLRQAAMEAGLVDSFP